MDSAPVWCDRSAVEGGGGRGERLLLFPFGSVGLEGEGAVAAGILAEGRLGVGGMEEHLMYIWWKEMSWSFEMFMRTSK